MKKLICAFALLFVLALGNTTLHASDTEERTARSFAYLDELGIALAAGANGNVTLSAGCGIKLENDGTFTDASSCDPTQWVTYGADGIEIFAEDYKGTKEIPDAIAFKRDVVKGVRPETATG
jgi:hypothetical protein